ncbi:MAG: metalloregulator ArsR/SmtB family transcription factor [Caldisericia bacterium]|nr:metalloregulator ArsR/SmtB family transcription factor [Caldisericia bacterium]
MKETMAILKALSDKGRCRILLALTTFDELCVCQLTEMMGLATATVSRHMSILSQANLVKFRKDKTWVHYSLSENISPDLLRWLINSTIQSEEIKKDKIKLDEILKLDSIHNCKVNSDIKGISK